MSMIYSTALCWYNVAMCDLDMENLQHVYQANMHNEALDALVATWFSANALL